MARPRAAVARKVKVGISLDPALHAWAVERIGEGREFATLTHAIERGLALLRERENGRTIQATVRERSNVAGSPRDHA